MEYLTDIQEQILYGHLLGDGCLELPNKKGKGNARFRIERKSEDIDYLKWSYNHFEKFCKNTIKSSVRNKIYKGEVKTFNSDYFVTRCLPVFTEYYRLWYPKGIKIIPRDITLTPLVLAIWFADDGSTHHPNSEKTLRAKFSTQSFSYDDVMWLMNELKIKYNVAASYKTIKPNQYVIDITGTNACKTLFTVINDCFLLKRKAYIWQNII